MTNEECLRFIREAKQSDSLGSTEFVFWMMGREWRRVSLVSSPRNNSGRNDREFYAQREIIQRHVSAILQELEALLARSVEGKETP